MWFGTATNGMKTIIKLLEQQISIQNCYTEFNEIPTYNLVSETTSQAEDERSVVVSIKALCLLRKELQHEFELTISRFTGY